MISIPMTINTDASIPMTVSASVVQPTGQMQAKTNINPTTSSQTITPDTGYDGLSSVQINAMPSGSATTPATSITANPTISVNSSTGVITASVSRTQSVTPTVSAGYVSSGTAGTVTVSGSNTSNLTTQGAQTIHPSSSDQTIASGKYLTGAQTIKGVTTTNLTAANIKKDVVVEIGDSTDSDCVTSVTGTYEGGGGSNHILMEDFLPLRIFENPDIDFGSADFYTISGTDSRHRHYYFSWTNMTSLRWLVSSSSAWKQCNNLFGSNTSLKTVVFPNLTGGQQSSAGGMFAACSALEKVDWGGSHYQKTFVDCSALKMLVIRTSSTVSLNNINVFTNTPFSSTGSGGTLYVPSSLISSYQSASNWSTILGYANNQIKSIESTHTDPTAPIDLTLYYADGTPIAS